METAITLKGVVVSGALLVSACAPYSYQDEVRDFAAATQLTVGAFDRLIDQKVFTEQHKRRLAIAKAHRDGSAGFVGVGFDCGGGATELLRDAVDDPSQIPVIQAQAQADCVIGVLNDAGEAAGLAPVAAPEPAAAKSAVEGKFTDLIAALDDYAKTLGAITDAADRTELEGAFDRGQMAFAKLGCVIDNQGCEGPSPEPTSKLGDVARAIGTAALDTMRFRTLRAATAEADPLIQRSANIMNEGQILLTSARLNDNVLRIETLQNHLMRNTKDAQDWLNTLDELIAERDAYLASFAGLGAFAAMRESHGDLTYALQNPQPDRQALRATINGFAKQAKAIQAAL